MLWFFGSFCEDAGRLGLPTCVVPPIHIVRGTRRRAGQIDKWTRSLRQSREESGVSPVKETRNK